MFVRSGTYYIHTEKLIHHPLYKHLELSYSKKALLSLEMLCEQAKYSDSSINKAFCSQYNVSVVTRIGAGRTWNRISIPVGDKRFFFPGRKLADRNWDPSLLSDWKGTLFAWSYNGRSVKLITHLHLLLRIKNDCSYICTSPYAFMTCTKERFFAWCGVKFQDPW